MTWRGDSQEVIVVQADAGCGEQTGTLVAPEPERHEDQRRGERATGDDPVYQPFVIGG